MQSRLPNEPNKSDIDQAAREQMKKKTAEELAAMAVTNRAFSAESSDEPPPPLVQKRSESSLAPLNAQLKSVPLVKAFNSAEREQEASKKK